MPARQQRSMERQQAILRAGQRLLQDIPFHALRMEQIAEAANCSVGTLYQRFKDKDALLDVILENVMARLDRIVTEKVSPERMATLTTRAAIRHVIALVHGFLASNQGLLCAIMARQLKQPDAISPLQRAGARLVSMSYGTMANDSSAFCDAVPLAQYQFAMQMVIGTLNNAIINRPGPFQIEDPKIVERLTDAACRIMGLQSTAT